MNKIKKLILFVLLVLFQVGVNCQITKKKISFPDAGIYKVLKCDLHMHTTFSDGTVPPVQRVEEAYQNDLDAISITDHIENIYLNNPDTVANHNNGFLFAKEAASRYGIILIPGAEITRSMPPGHFNVLFIKDANPFSNFVNKQNVWDGTYKIREALEEARRQDAFVFWNHPPFPNPKKVAEWFPLHDEFFNSGLFSGIEIVNGYKFYPEAFMWCIEKNMTVLANTDIHGPVQMSTTGYGLAHRTMTLILATERNDEAIKEALIAGRTIAVLDNKLFGKEENVKAVFSSAFQIKARYYKNAQLFVEFVNESGIPFSITTEAKEAIAMTKHFKVGAYEVHGNNITINEKKLASSKIELTFSVNNIFITPTENLKYSYSIDLNDFN